MTAEAIIARCTRNGVTSWQHVAAQLGCSVDQARSRYDRQYLPVRPWPHPCEEIKPEAELEPIDENDTHSLAPKGPGMLVEIVQLLGRIGPMTVAELSARLHSPTNSVRMRLSKLRGEGLVENDNFAARSNGVYEWTWRLTRDGRTRAASLPMPTVELIANAGRPERGLRKWSKRDSAAVTGCAGSIMERV